MGKWFFKGNQNTRPLDFVGELPKATRPLGPVLAIGGAEMEDPELEWRRQIIYVDSSELNWRKLFSKIAVPSRAIFLFPSASAGVLEEVSAIVKVGFVGKTIVLMPPAGVDGQFSLTVFKTLEASWSETRERWGRSGLRLPPYSDNGLLYMPREDFSVKHGYVLRFESGAMKRGLDWLLPKLEGASGSTASLLEEIDEVIDHERNKGDNV
jgi:hypothetical protein